MLFKSNVVTNYGCKDTEETSNTTELNEFRDEWPIRIDMKLVGPVRPKACGVKLDSFHYSRLHDLG